MKNSYKFVIPIAASILVSTLFSVPTANATARLGDWELLFDNDDGRAIAIDVYRDTPVILDEKGGIYFLNKEIGGERKGEWFGEVFENWQKVSGSGNGIDISVDGNGVPWVIERNTNRVLYLDGNLYDSHGWIEHPGNAKARKISVSSVTGTPYIIGARSGHIFKGTDKGWQRLPIALTGADGNPTTGPLNAVDLAVDAHEFMGENGPETHERILAINKDGRIYKYHAHNPGEAWQELQGDMRAVRVAGMRGLTYIIGEDKKFYGIHLPVDKSWQLAGPGTGKDLARSEVGVFQPFVGSGKSMVRYLWTVGEKGRVFRAFVGH